jgi:uncharacterized protein YjbI with pentapeptide repeats
MDPERVWRALLGGERLDRLNLPTKDGRIDLSGLAAPKPSAAHEYKVPNAHVKQMANLVVVRGATWQGIDFSKCRLESLRFFDSVIENCSFDGAQCRDWRIWGTTIRNCSFRGADLRGSALGGIDNGKRNSFQKVDFTKADLRRTAHGSADMTACVFINANLSKVDFQGTIFVDCTFAGELREVLFYRHAFRGEAFPPNEMKGVDFRRARFRYVEFRGLDMDDVQWPEDSDHVVVENYKVALDRMLEFVRHRSDTPAQVIASTLELDRKWAGPNQRRGVINKADLLEAGDPALVTDLLQVCGKAVN